MNTHPMSTQLTEMAWQIERFGYDAITPQQLHQVQDAARESGVRSSLVELLTDQTAPLPVRTRAFGRLACMIARHLPHRPAATISDDQVVCAA